MPFRYKGIAHPIDLTAKAHIVASQLHSMALLMSLHFVKYGSASLSTWHLNRTKFSRPQVPNFGTGCDPLPENHPLFLNGNGAFPWQGAVCYFTSSKLTAASVTVAVGESVYHQSRIAKRIENWAGSTAINVFTHSRSSLVRRARGRDV